MLATVLISALCWLPGAQDLVPSAVGGGSWVQRWGPVSEIGYSLMGEALALVGDISGSGGIPDGYGDLVAGRPRFRQGLSSLGAYSIHSGFTGHNGNGVYAGSGGRFGQAFAAVGQDLTGDGLADFLVGAYLEGRVELHTGTNGRVVGFDSPEVGDWMGVALAVGDLTGDAFPDLIFGASLAVHPTLGESRGRVYVHSGDPNTSFSLIRQVEGQSSNERFGASLAVLDDLDGDGRRELAVGAPRASWSWLESGAVYVFSGSGGLLYRLEGDQAEAKFGQTLAALDDVDGDGFSDLLVGAPNQDVAGVLEAGQVSLYSGLDGSLLRRHFGNGGQTFHFGAAVESLKDVNGDGFGDYAVSAPEEDNPNGSWIKPGAVHVFSGADGVPMLRVHSRRSLEKFGKALAGGRSADGDWVPDLAVGAPGFEQFGPANADGAVYLFALEPHISPVKPQILSASAGGNLEFRVDFPFSQPTAVFQVLASLGGITPQVSVAGYQLPLGDHSWLRASLQRRYGNLPFDLIHPVGVLHQGRSRFQLEAAPGQLQPWVGQKIHLVAVAASSPISPLIEFCSVVASVEIVP
ncbi:MAG: hypothetical protein DWQ01_07420 [Planctomycetota bacterium]|nr:MAG: hypothetical protein DWQ01_07420 [Planctomycetota bacterium]